MLGVDFGTCLSSVVVARPDGSRIRVKDPGSASASVPSAAAVAKSGDLLWGKAAQRVRLSRPFVDQFKRRLGDETPLKIGEHELAPSELTGRFLGWLATLARDAGDSIPVTSVVVTVPASYESTRRALMSDAARAAGFDPGLVMLVEEPVAAAAFAVEDRPAKAGERLVVYDLGGGTFDVAVVAVTAAGFEVLAHDGAGDVGGIHFDRLVRDEVLASEEAAGLREVLHRDDDEGTVRRRRAGLELMEFCREFKEQLSSDESHEDLVPQTDEFFELSRDRFDELIAPLLAETLDRCDSAVAEAGLSWDEVDRIVMVGGSTRIPGVRELLVERYGRPVQTVTDPELAVAEGAALLAAQGLAKARTRSNRPPAAPRVLVEGALDAAWSGRAAFVLRQVSERECELQRLDAVTGAPDAAVLLGGDPRIMEAACGGVIVTAADPMRIECFDPDLVKVAEAPLQDAQFVRTVAAGDYAWIFQLANERQVAPKRSRGSEYDCQLTRIAFADGNASRPLDSDEIPVFCHVEWLSPSVRGARIERLDPSGTGNEIVLLWGERTKPSPSADPLKYAGFFDRDGEVAGGADFGSSSGWDQIGQDLAQVQRWDDHLLLAFDPNLSVAIRADGPGPAGLAADMDPRTGAFPQRKSQADNVRWASGPHGAWLLEVAPTGVTISELEPMGAEYEVVLEDEGLPVCRTEYIHSFDTMVGWTGSPRQVDGPDRTWLGLSSRNDGTLGLGKIVGLAHGIKPERFSLACVSVPVPVGVSADGGAVDVLVDNAVLRIDR